MRRVRVVNCRLAAAVRGRFSRLGRQATLSLLTGGSRMKGENSRLPQGRKLVQGMSAEQREDRQREALAERERLRKEQAAKREGD